MTQHQFGGQWTNDKLERLRKYLRTYTIIFHANEKARKLFPIYIDAFAGTGYRTPSHPSSGFSLPLPELTETDNQEFLKGSACIALDVEPPFRQYIFIEREPQRVLELENLKNEYPHRASSIKVINEDANSFLIRWCDSMGKFERAVMFLDPYGMQVEWQLIEAVAKTQKIDLWILFPLGVAINRMLTKSSPPPLEWADSLTRQLGTDDWKNIFYPTQKVMTLFGNEDVQLKQADFDKIGKFFVQRLKTVFTAVAENPLPLMNSKNNPLYLLCFAAGNPKVADKAVKIAQDIFKVIEMATQTKIEWTEMTWNPITGCSKISAGCKNCYAERMAKRLQAMGVERYRNAFQVTLHEDLVDLPRRWKQPRLVFVNSMSDLFHEDVPLTFIKYVFATMADCPQHNFQILTKRSSRLQTLAPLLQWTPNIWMGVTVENSRETHRIQDLRAVPAAIRFLSCEPLIGSLEHLNLSGIHWVIVGGESGPGARTMSNLWVKSLFYQCRTAGVPFFFKQWGGVRKHRAGRELHGRTYEEMPISLIPKLASQRRLPLS